MPILKKLADNKKHEKSEDFLPISRGRISAHSQSKIATFFPITMSEISHLRKVKKTKTFFSFFRFLETTTTYENNDPCHYDT